jgi:hypothetical protein
MLNPERNKFSDYEKYKCYFHKKYPSGFPMSEEEFYKSSRFVKTADEPKIKLNHINTGGDKPEAEITTLASKSHYPIILKPEILDKILRAKPSLPAHPAHPSFPTQPQKPKESCFSDPPQEVKKIQGRFFYSYWAIGLAILAFLFSANFAGVLIAIGLILFAAIDSSYLYNNRFQQYHSNLKKYKDDHVKWIQDKKKWDKKKALKIAKWEEGCRKLDDNWEKEKASITEQHELVCKNIMLPENIRKWRTEEILKTPKFKPYFVESDAPVGKLDNKLYDSLKINFPELNILRDKKIMVPGKDWGYTPDVIIQDCETNIWLDIEIDEPWHLKNKEKFPSHYIGKDDARNMFFTSQGWVVIRLSECQFLNHPKECMKLIAQELGRFRLNSPKELEARFLLTADLPKIPHWTKEESTKIPRPLSSFWPPTTTHA